MASNVKNNKKFDDFVISGERSQQITKIEHESGGWTFFKHLYSSAMFRLLLLNILMILFLAPAVVVIFLASSQLTALSSNLPYSSTFGLGIMPWFGIEPYLQQSTLEISTKMYLWLFLAIPVATIGFSGGFAVIRDSYWTGKLRIFKSFGNGICQGALPFLPFTIFFPAALFGLFHMNNALASSPDWLVIVINVVAWIVVFVVMMFGFLFLAVSLLYKQGIAKNFADTCKLFVRYFFGNVMTFVFVILPVVLLYVINSSFVTTFVLTLMFMFGMIYIGLIWMIHVMRICKHHAR